jgi:ubiquinone/menaquinone biosynthesis C-methylase UbiE
MDSTKMTSELESLKNKLRATWTAGDFAEIAKSIQSGAEEFVARLDLKPGTTVLDVACGNGNTAIPAAFAGADVTGVDIAPYLIEQAIERAAQEKASAEFDVGDAEDLPYEPESFDLVMTMFGAMFAPRPEIVVSELERVCRPGRSDRDGELDSRRFHRTDVQDYGQVRCSARGNAIAAFVGR